MALMDHVAGFIYLKVIALYTVQIWLWYVPYGAVAFLTVGLFVLALECQDIVLEALGIGRSIRVWICTGMYVVSFAMRMGE